MAKAGISVIWNCEGCSCRDWVHFLYEAPEWQKPMPDGRPDPRPTDLPSDEEREASYTRIKAEHSLTGCRGKIAFGGGINRTFGTVEEADAWLKLTQDRPASDRYNPLSILSGRRGYTDVDA